VTQINIIHAPKIVGEREVFRDIDS
jgi:hypothetical protein